MTNKKFSPARMWDYTFACDICGAKCWASEGTVLDVYTGRGGAFVCPECNDPIDYGLVPYKIPAEKPVPISRDAYYTGGTIPANLNTTVPFDTAFLDPMSTSTSQSNAFINTVNATWDQLLYQTWDKWNVPWGSLPSILNAPEDPQ